MPASDYTFNLTPARRPSLADVGGATKKNDARYPPDPEINPTAEEWNFFARAAAAYGGVIPAALLDVAIIAGAPAIMRFASPSASVAAESFTITDNGAGDTTIAWAVGLLPPPVAKPQVWVTDDGAWLQPVALVPSTVSVRVKTRNSAGVLTDAAFTVAVF